MNTDLELIGATLVTIAAAIALTIVGPRELDWLPDGFEKPVLALELVRTPQDFHNMASQTALQPPQSSAHDRYRLNTLIDFGFIAAYAFLWAAILRQIPGTPGLAGVTLVLAAACADIVEDVGILYGLRADLPGVQIVRTIRSAALVKWGLLGVAFLLLAYRFRPGREVRDGWQLWSAAIALAYAYGGVLCLVGLFHTPVIERSALPIGAALLMQIALFWHERRADAR